MKKNQVIFVAVLMLLLAVGFAAVSTSFIIGNHTTIGTNPNDLNIYFAEASTDEGGTATISQDKKSITFSTKSLTEVQDFAEVDFYVFNASVNYDGIVSINIDYDPVINNVDYSEYFAVSSRGIGSSVEYINALSYEFGYVRITLLKPVIDDVEITFTVTITTTAVERDYLAVQRPQFMNILSGSGKNVGDEISLYGEHFYLLSKEGTTLNYISKYLLNVGSYTEDGVLGIQNSGCNGGRKCFNTIDTQYYLDRNDDYLPKYVSDSLPYYVYDENNTDYQYIEDYVHYLSIKCNITMTGRLVNYNDISWFENGVVLTGGKGEVNMPSWFNVNGDFFKLGISGEEYNNTKFIWTVEGSSITYFNSGAGVKPVISFDESVIDNLEQ